MAKLVVIGSGVVGQATGKGFASIGHEVVFLDINQETLKKLEKEGYKTCTPETLSNHSDAEAYFFAINTPTVDGEIKLSYLESALSHFAGVVLKNRNDFPLAVIRSTVPPKTIEKIFIPLMENYSGRTAGKDFGVCTNPEYLRENRNEDDFKNPWIIIIGELDKNSGDALEKIYRQTEWKCPIFRLTLDEAEIQKYIHNIFNACKISFFNEMRMVCEDLKIDADKVFQLVAKSAEASWNQNYGIRNMGHFSGTCLPKDTSAFLSWVQKTLGQPMSLLAATIEVNDIARKKNQVAKDEVEILREKSNFYQSGVSSATA